MESNEDILEPPTVSTTPAGHANEGIRFQQCTEDFRIGLDKKMLDKTAYKCDSECRGRALIMNNKSFYHNIRNMPTRYGSDADIGNLVELFQGLNFDTVVHSDKSAEDMLAILTEESREDHHKKYDMFVLFLMSHGINGVIYGNDCEPLNTEDIWNMFDGRNCPNLLEKPKLFFIQACQGNIMTLGVTPPMGASAIACDSASPVLESVMEMVRKLKQEDDINLSIPSQQRLDIQCDAVDGNVHELVDMAFFYAAIQGYTAFRDTKTGSLFVKCLIDVLTMEAHQKDLLAMATLTSNRMHELEVTESGYKAAGYKRDSLRKEVYLPPK